VSYEVVSYIYPLESQFVGELYYYSMTHFHNVILLSNVYII